MNNKTSDTIGTMHITPGIAPGGMINSDRTHQHIPSFIRRKGVLLLALAAVLVTFGAALTYELRTSTLQSRLLTRAAQRATFAVEPGAAGRVWYPSFGPYDERLGYTRIPRIIDNLVANDFSITSQARQSPELLNITSKGLYPPYSEKTKAGLTILDRNNVTIYSSYRPERMYESFDAIPSPIIQSLLFIENREILNQAHPYKNPAVEWDRFGLAILEKAKQVIFPNINAPGGSTIATQLEKYRHSNEGRTSGIRDKLRQMGSASLRAYLYGRDTLETRKLITQHYINSIPLAALRGYGEVNGLGDGLWAWYGVEFEDVNRKLRALALLPPGSDMTPYAEAYKQVLSLFIAHRRPSFYLIDGLKELNALTDTHLDLLAREGIIPANLRDAAKKISLELRRSAPKTQSISFVQRKAANAIRTRLLSLLKYPQLYDLDQVDLTVKSTMDNDANERVTDILRRITDDQSVRELGLGGSRNLAKGDPSKVIYSLTLFERVGTANLLRVQTDNFDNPFSINEGTRLDLGSTAKLRTLTTYLVIVGEAYDRYAGKSKAELDRALDADLDPISEFVAKLCALNPRITLSQMLEMALDRRYSASPYESFFTGGGLHTFENFKKEDNGGNPSIRQSIVNSINLPFVRLMRDISRYYQARLGVKLGSGNADRQSAMRQHFLQKFADQEGSYFTRRFYEKYRGKLRKDLLPGLVLSTRASARHAAAMHRYVRPSDSRAEFERFLTETLPNTQLPGETLDKWYTEFAPGLFDLNDQAYLARTHPLELWLVKYMQDTPDVTIEQILAASKEERQLVYRWLFKTPNTRAQDIRIRSLLEHEAFNEIHKQWRDMGYPFNSMVPSLASALGSSGDRPIALAELVGIILNDGMRYPLVRLDELHFASETPFDVTLQRSPSDSGQRVLKPEVAHALKGAMSLVVSSGTARRVHQAFKRSDGSAYVIGGKTGTGDHRHETYGPGGRVTSSRVVNRTATFAFYLGDRFFGVISAHVPGPEAAQFDFTSALAAQLLKVLAPSLEPMIERSGAALSPFPNQTATKAPRGTPAALAVDQAILAPLQSPQTPSRPSKGGKKALILAPPA
ncbi:MAG: transglycosylase domain-containing protein [Pseudomonadota bacterium]